MRALECASARMIVRRWYLRRRLGSSMPPTLRKLKAAELQQLHGAELARPPLSELQSPYLLHLALDARRPRIPTTYQAVRTWWNNYRSGLDGSDQRIHDVEMLESEYGDSLRGSIQE